MDATSTYKLLKIIKSLEGLQQNTTADTTATTTALTNVVSALTTFMADSAAHSELVHEDAQCTAENTLATNAKLDVTNTKLQSILSESALLSECIHGTGAHDRHVHTRLHSSTTSFGEMMTAEYTPALNIRFGAPINSSIVTTAIAGSGTVTRTTGPSALGSANHVLCQTGTTTASSASVTSVETVPYYTGVGIIARFTAIFMGPIDYPTAQMLIGLKSSTGGFYFGYNGNVFGIIAGDTPGAFIPQSSWNGDPFNGTGPSGLVLDPSYGNVYQIKYQWLGYGAQTFWIEDPVSGDFILVHTIQYANQFRQTSLGSPDVQAHLYVTNGESLGLNSKLFSASFMIGHEGKPNANIGIQFSTYSDGKTLPSANTLYNVLTIRNPATLAGSGDDNNVPIKLMNISTLASVSNRPMCVRVVVAPASFGSALTYGAVHANSIAEAATDTVTVTGGRISFSYWIAAGTSSTADMHDQNLIIYPGQVVTIGAFTTGGTNGGISLSASWFERV